MNIVKTSLGLTKTIRNVTRFREILSVFARHGFDEFIIKTNLDKLIPNFVIPKSRFKLEDDLPDYDFWKSVGYRLRKSFEELGPSFIKLGQLLSTREDIFNPGLIAELKKLQDQAKPIEFSQAIKLIESELGQSHDKVFTNIDEKPIGVASIGVVYRAQLISGEDVVIKVQRPNIKRTILTDFEIIEFIVSKLEAVSREIKYLGVSRAIADFFKGINFELNFLIEANNNKKLKSNLAKIDTKNILKVPLIYREFCTEKLLVMEFLNGKSFNEINDPGTVNELRPILIDAVKLFLKTMLKDGFFHADLHGGNFFLLEDDNIGLIDFGLVGVLSKKNRANLVAILYGVLTNNFENLVFEFLDVAEYENIPNHEVLISDIRDSLTPFLGMSVQEMDATLLTHAIVSTLSKHQIYLPREWFIIFRALMTLDGVGKSLDIDLNIFEVIDDEIKDIVTDLISKDALIEDGVWLGRDLLNSLRVVPRHLKWVLREFSKKNYVIDINPVGIRHELNLLTRSMYFIGMMFMSAAMFMGGILVVKDIEIKIIQDVPILALISWGGATLIFIRASLIYKLK